MDKKDRDTTLPLIDRDAVQKHLEACDASGLQNFAEYFGGVVVVRENPEAFAETCGVIGAIRYQYGDEEAGMPAFTLDFLSDMRERLLKAYDLSCIAVVQ